MTRPATYDRDEALTAAQQVFWEKGYHATSLKDMEAALGMGPGSIYGAFKNKEALFCEVLTRYHENNARDFQKLIAQAPSPLAALARFFDLQLEVLEKSAATRACLLVKTVLNATPAEETITATARRLLSAFEGEIEAGFIMARDAGELNADADTKALARQFQSDVTALRIAAHRELGPGELAQMAERYKQFYLGLERKG